MVACYPLPAPVLSVFFKKHAPDMICERQSKEARESDEPNPSASSSDVKHLIILASMTVVR